VPEPVVSGPVVPTVPEPAVSRRVVAGPVAVVGGAVLAAVAVNLVIYGLGRAAGGSFEFTASNGPAEVTAPTVAGFSAVPLLAGLLLLLLVRRFATWAGRAALVVAPALALGTILVMTLPADLDGISTLTLALCHATLAPTAVLAIRSLEKP
jgi:hypothetical protein